MIIQAITHYHPTASFNGVQIATLYNVGTNDPHQALLVAFKTHQQRVSKGRNFSVSFPTQAEIAQIMGDAQEESLWNSSR